jgi:CRP/FNR family cyclic AMP-dependent transcriptional regulator
MNCSSSSNKARTRSRLLSPILGDDVIAYARGETMKKNKTQNLQSLEDLELFAGCSTSELVRIRSLVTGIRVEPGTVLLEEGTLGREFLIITDGEAVVTSDDEVLATLGAGDFAGEMSLLSGQPRSATVTATTALDLFVCNPAEFASLLDVSPAAGMRIALTGSARREANMRTRAA